MKMLKLMTLRSLPLICEQLCLYLTVELLWLLLCGKSPFSLGLYLLAGALTVCANTLYLQKRRSGWSIFLFNVMLCLLWAPPLAKTLDHTYEVLLFMQLPQFLLPAIRGYQHGTARVTILRLQNYGDFMAIYGLFYLIVASFVPAALFRVPLLLAALVLQLLAVVLMRTTGRNTVRAGGRGGLAPTLIIFVLLGAAAAAAGLLLDRVRARLLAAAAIAWAAVSRFFLSVFTFLMSLGKSQRHSGGSATESQSVDVGALPESAPESSLLGQILLGLLIFALTAATAIMLWSLLQWLWRSCRRSSRQLDDDEFFGSGLPHQGLLSRLLSTLRIRMFLLRRTGTPRAALLRLERWGAARHCRRRREETPREYLLRLRQEKLVTVLPEDMQKRYTQLINDVDASLYGDRPPKLSREEIRELVAALKTKPKSA